MNVGSRRAPRVTVGRRAEAGPEVLRLSLEEAAALSRLASAIDNSTIALLERFRGRSVNVPQPPERHEAKTYLSIPQLCDYINLSSPWAAYKWIKRAGVVPCRIGRKISVLRRDVDEAMQQFRGPARRDQRRRRP